MKLKLVARICLLLVFALQQANVLSLFAQYKVLIEDGKLKAIGNSGAKFDLLAESETKFFIRERPVEFVFVRDASGRVTEMVLNSNGQDIRLKKL